jgi:hypothetical protein
MPMRLVERPGDLVLSEVVSDIRPQCTTRSMGSAPARCAHLPPPTVLRGALDIGQPRADQPIEQLIGERHL